MNAIKLSLLQEQLEGVAEVMGSALARSAFSPNIRVRLDFSCALFGPQGDLLAQAAHIPVHLGSMPDQIKQLIAHHSLEPGDLFIGNDPYDGGTHLPDITIMEPIFGDHGECLGVAAARAHHADVGGTAPGSMASQPNIYGDGLRIPILKLGQAGRWDERLSALLLANMRSPADREGDLLAQQAACRQGRLGLQRVFQQWAKADLSYWEQGLSKLRQASRAGTLQLLRDLLVEGATATYQDFLEVNEQLATIRVTLSLSPRGHLVADFTGSSAGVAASFNATLPVTKAAVCYVVRCLTAVPLAMNQGFLDCIEMKAPAGTVVSAIYPLAVAAGNVETSQRIVDVIFGAFHQLAPGRSPAASAGTMNNFSFGFTDPQFGVHYETSGGGAGGCPGGPSKSCSGVQVHMTNTLSTPAEVLEEEFPVVVRRHQTRPGSGGAGEYAGGDGTIKEFIFLEEASVTIMATRRKTVPYGLQGGEPGAPGEQRIRLPGQDWAPTAASSTQILPPQSHFILETPGGGGWGAPDDL
jgi:N-methylhydantoinase B